jgi:superfamily II DNA or RNA helicase
MVIPPDDYMSSANEKLCINFFRELFTIEDLKKLIEDFDPLNVERRNLKKPLQIKNFNKSKENRKTLYEILNIKNEKDVDKLSKHLYTLVGPNFLYEVRGAQPNDDNSRLFRYELLKKSIEIKRFDFEYVNGTIKDISGIGFDSLEEIKTTKNKKLVIGSQDGSGEVSANAGQRWLPQLLELFQVLPTETIEKPSTSTSNPSPHFTVIPIRELKPLHDYQIYAGQKILDTIKSEKGSRKRLLFSIPTGAGKTRLVCESLIDWINDDKQSKDERIRKSKYIIWIAQSRELCEQAISQFEEIYSKKGAASLDIFRFYGEVKPSPTLESILENPPKNYGLIVGTIDKFYAVIPNKEKISSNVDPDSVAYEQEINKKNIPLLFHSNRAFEELRNLTSCITIDEAHKGITGSYTAVLRGFGFNFSFTSDESKLNENGITLVGLTATAFRGTGLEKSQHVTLVDPFMGEVTIQCSNQLNSRVKTPVSCAVCKKELPLNEIINQATSNKKLLWHEDCNKTSTSTSRLYTRFSTPIIPNIRNFKENTKPIAIISCNEKFIANDPMRIDGTKSFDPQGGNLKYFWTIERISELTEVFNIKEKEIEKSSSNKESFTTKKTQSGKHRITLTIKNFDDEESTTTKIIEIIPPEIDAEKSKDMQSLMRNLKKRNILCDVFHSITKSNTQYSVEGDTIAMQQTDLLKKVAQNQERNQKIINMIQYLLTKPQNKRKKILVFSCDIAHARFLAMWLKMIGISADYVDSKLSASRNIPKIKKFRNKSDENGQVLINTNMLTTGFDVPDVDCVVMGRPVMSTVEYTQMIGRGMRGTRMGGTKEVWILDFDDQVQRKKEMNNQFISLGWKAMAFDENGNNLWKKLEKSEKDIDGNLINLNAISETSENSKSVYVSKDNEIDESNFDETETGLLSRHSHESVFNETNMNTEKLSPKLNNPWIEFVDSEKTNPISLEFIKFIVSNSNGRSALDIETIIDLRKIVKRIIGYQTNMNNAQINLLYSNYDRITLNILEKLFQDSKEKIQKNGLIKFTTATIIAILKPIKENGKIIDLCDSYIRSQDLLKNISYQKELNKPKPSMDVQLEKEFTRITYDVLGFIPDENHFKKHVSSELYKFLIERFSTYFSWQRNIDFSSHQLRIQKRSECLVIVIDIITQKKISPTRDMLESLIPDFDIVIINNFFHIDTFFTMVRDIFESYKKTPKTANFSKIESDYEFVKNLNNFEPKTEEILRHSKLGIGSYMKYCGNVANFVQIRELDREIIVPETNNIARINLEILKSKFMEMKSALKRIPTKDEMSIHSNYDQIIEYYWFNGYADFLKFLGENTLHVKKPLEKSTTTSTSKEDIIEEDSKFLKKNGSRDLFDKILCEGEFKYTVNFGSVSEYLKILFPQDKKMMLNMWDDRKKDFNSDNCP